MTVASAILLAFWMAGCNNATQEQPTEADTLQPETEAVAVEAAPV